MTLLEQKIIEFLADGDQLLTEEDICSHFYNENEQSVMTALNSLERSGKLYCVDSFAGKMYGIDSTEESDVVTLGDLMSDAISQNYNFKSVFVTQFPKHISEIDPSYLDINDKKYKSSKLTKKFLNEWINLVETHKNYLKNIKLKSIEAAQESVLQNFGEMDFHAFTIMKVMLKEELKELASIRSMYLSEIVETVNAVLKDADSNSENVNELLNYVYYVFEYNEEDITFNGGQDRIYVPVPKVNELRNKIVKPNKETKSKPKTDSKKVSNLNKTKQAERKNKLEEIQKKVDTYVKKNNTLELEEIERTENDFTQKIENLNQEISSTTNKLSSLGFFAFNEKKRLEQLLENLKAEVIRTQEQQKEAIEKIKIDYSRMNIEYEKKLKRSILAEDIKDKISTEGKTAMEITRDYYMTELIDAIVKKGKMTFEQLTEQPVLCDITHKTIKEILESLIQSSDIERFNEDGCWYYDFKIK